MIRKICERCGANGDTLHRMAHAYWDEDSQTDSVYSYVDDVDWFCDNCGCETQEEEVELEWTTEIVRCIDGNTFDTEPFEEDAKRVKELVDELGDTVDKTKPILYNVFVQMSPSREGYIEDEDEDDGYRKERKSDFDIIHSSYFYEYNEASTFAEAINEDPTWDTHDKHDNGINFQGVDLHEHYKKQREEREKELENVSEE